jgi:Family of unknown function (DUF6422)
MSGTYRSKNLTEEQSKALEKAALLIINARKEAAAMLTRAGAESSPDTGWFGSPCGASLPPPPQHHRCGCRNYTGDGGPCETTYIDHTGPDLGTGSPRRTCGHLPSDHLET